MACDVGEDTRRQIEAVSTFETRTISNCGQCEEEEDQ